MSKTLQKFVKYTKKELEDYSKLEGSCVKKVNSKMHLLLAPYALSNMQTSIMMYIRKRKVGSYDVNLNGIILEVKNIKLLGTAAALRFDDPRMHIQIIADFYIFQPVEGAILSAIVRHIGNSHVGALLYRVFNTNIRFKTIINTNLIELNKDIKFRIMDFNMQNVFPYIEGEIILDDSKSALNPIGKLDNDSTADSGIEEKYTNELDNNTVLIKKEPATEDEFSETPSKGRKDKVKKEKRKNVDSTDSESPEKKIVKGSKKKTVNKIKTENMFEAEINSNTPKKKISGSKKKSVKKVSIDVDEIYIKEEPLDTTLSD